MPKSALRLLRAHRALERLERGLLVAFSGKLREEREVELREQRALG